MLADTPGDQEWREWHQKADCRPALDSLVLPDSASRVQAVIDGRGIALWDALVATEVRAGEAVYVSDIRLEDAEYHLVFPRGAPDRAVVTDFRERMRAEASGEGSR